LKEVEKAYGEVPYILNFMKQSPELLVTKVLYDNAITGNLNGWTQKQ